MVIDAQRSQEITVREQMDLLVEAIKACGPGWHNRSDIAKQLGKKRLDARDATLLELLVESGRVEAKKESVPGPIAFAWYYQVKE
jgi:hypothetical protein